MMIKSKKGMKTLEVVIGMVLLLLLFAALLPAITNTKEGINKAGGFLCLTKNIDPDDDGLYEDIGSGTVQSDKIDNCPCDKKGEKDEKYFMFGKSPSICYAQVEQAPKKVEGKEDPEKGTYKVLLSVEDCEKKLLQQAGDIFKVVYENKDVCSEFWKGTTSSGDESVTFKNMKVYIDSLKEEKTKGDLIINYACAQKIFLKEEDDETFSTICRHKSTAALRKACDDMKKAACES